MKGARPFKKTFVGLIGLLFLLVASQTASLAEDNTPEGPLPSRLPLLDESVLEKYSHPLPKTEDLTDKEYPPDVFIPLETKNLLYYSYFTKIKRRIDQAYFYPREAAADLLYGTVSVAFEINRDGSLGDLKIAQSSGKEALDEAALEIIKKASPFSRVPGRIRHEPLRVLAQIVFIPTEEAVKGPEALDLISIPLK
jgi:TonB family protein